MHLRSGAKIVPNLTPRAKTTKVTKRRSQIKEPTPEPTPKTEERSLDPNVLEAMSQANASSPLLRLPQEIKNMIYNFVIDAHAIHIERNYEYHTKPGQLFRNSICEADLPNPDDDEYMTPEERADWLHQMTPQELVYWHEYRWDARHNRCQATDSDWMRHTRRHRIVNNWTLPGLLFSCRQIHGEARLIPYSKLTFSFDYPTYPEGWARTLSPAQMAAVRNIHLGNFSGEGTEWVGATGCMLGRLRDVRNIELQLRRPDRYGGGDDEGLEDLGRLNLGPATLIVREGARQVATFTGTPKDGLVRSITASEWWG